MSCVTINLGQCGTQIGHALLNNLYQEATVEDRGHLTDRYQQNYADVALDLYFNITANGKHEARCVMVDMEPKAINKVLKCQSKQSWNYASGQQFFYNSGSGNNWAYGYHKLGARFRGQVMDMIRKEVEKCDSLDGFLVLMSIAGGTGSGVGSYYLNQLRDFYPRSTIVNPYVLPYSQGEVAVQYYNAVLSLANMNCSSNVCVSLHNNRLHEMCASEMLIKDVSFTHMNALASRQLSSALLPSLSNDNQRFCKNKLRDLVLATTGGSGYKILDITSAPNLSDSSIPFTTFSWKSLFNDAYKSLRRGSNAQDPADARFISTLFMLRGREVDAVKAEDMRLPSESCFPTWVGEEDRVQMWRCRKPIGKYEKSLTVLSNGTSCVEPLSNVCQKSWKLFASKSYVHQYYKHGLEECDFEASIATVQSITSSYNSL